VLVGAVLAYAVLYVAWRVQHPPSHDGLKPGELSPAKVLQ
jgi:membrane-associated phospholipid phosphatase